GWSKGKKSFAFSFSSTSDTELDAVFFGRKVRFMDLTWGLTCTATLQYHKDEVAGDIFNMLFMFMDFLAFKEMFLGYGTEGEGWVLGLSSGLVVSLLCKSSSLPASQSNLRPKGPPLGNEIFLDCQLTRL
uniref:ADP-ribosylation factor-like protein 2-binding protein n=1 Tax=Lynx canadensis TaxID=61383 RepID=A0A667HTH5_LYNCA